MASPWYPFSPTPTLHRPPIQNKRDINCAERRKLSGIERKINWFRSGYFCVIKCLLFQITRWAFAFHIHSAILFPFRILQEEKNPLLLQTLDFFFFPLLFQDSEIFPIKWFMKATLSFSEFPSPFYWFLRRKRRKNRIWRMTKGKMREENKVSMEILCLWIYFFGLCFLCINRKTNNKESFCVLGKVEGEIFYPL